MRKARREMVVQLVRCVGAFALTSAGCFADVQPDYASKTLSGDWNGQRNVLYANGLDLELRSWGTYQNIIDGGYRSADEILGGTALEVRLDTARAGMWSGGELRVRGEARYGDDVQRSFGGFNAVNVDIILPHDPDRVGRDVASLTELVFSQVLTPRLSVFAGLLNSEEDDDNIYAGNLRRRDSFMNVSFLTSPVRLRLSPQAALGFGLHVQPTAQLSGEVRVYDGSEAVGDSLFDLRDGTMIATEWTYQHAWRGHAFRHLLGFRYGFDRDFSLAGTEDPHLLALLSPSVPATRSDTWAFYYNASVAMTDWGGGRGWGLFLRLGYGDNDANPVDWGASFGAVFTGPFASRPRDTLGMGHFHIYQVDTPLLKRYFEYDDEQGLEAWYNAELMPWLHVTADIQLIDTDINRKHPPALSPVVMPDGLGASSAGAGALVGREASDASWIFGLRTEVKF